MSQKDVIAFLERHKGSRIALISHMRPDGDALGPCIGLADVLRSLGCHARVVNVFPIPENLEFLASDLLVRHESPDWHKGYDCLGVLDCGEPGRVDLVNREAARTLPAFNIDHHASSRGIGEAVWNEPFASSTGEMVVRLCKAAGWPLTFEAARALWTAIITDTGRFSFENTGVSALAAAMDCLAAGVKPHEVAAHVYQSVTLAERRLQYLTLSRMELLEGGKLAVSWLRKRDFEEAGIGVEGAGDLIDMLRETKGVDVAVILYDVKDDEVKLSIRCASPHNAIEVVKLFGGGGHMRAAGASLPAPVEEATARVVEAVRKVFFAG